MSEIATSAPTSFTKGETVVWRKSFEDYPADTWTLRYYFRGSATGIDITATQYLSGADFLVTITAAANTLAAGVWYYQAYVTSGSEKYLVDDGQVTVLADLSVVNTTTFDLRSGTKIILDAIRATILGKASKDQQEYEIRSGDTLRRLKTLMWADLVEAEKYYAAKYAREQQAQRLKDGFGPFKTIKTRFTRPE